MVYTLGGSGQLPPVMIKTIYNKYYKRPETSGFVGKIAVHNFIHPPYTIEATMNIVVMDKVLRQDNPEFLSLLNHL